MRYLLFYFLFSLAHSISAQTLKGSVGNEANKPLSGVSIYIDGSTQSTLTDENGNFNLETSAKTGNLVFTKTDYSTVVFPVRDALNKKLKVILQKESLIEAVNIIPYTDRDFERNLTTFQYAFLGDVALTKINNKKDLLFAIDKNKEIFRAKAKQALVIENKNLGYNLQFGLMNFEKTPQTLSYSGTSFFTELKGGKRQLEKYAENRRHAFLGSAMHFFRSLYQNNFTENGFNVNRVKIIPNPEYPSQLELDQLDNYYKNEIQLDKIINIDNLPLGLQKISRNARKPKTLLIVLKTSLSKEEFTSDNNGELHLKFDNLIQIVFIAKDKTVIDTIIDADGNEFQVYPDGTYSDPEMLILSGSWANYKVSKMLPTDYKP